VTTAWRDVPGSTQFDQAVLVAGALAEAGVKDVVLRSQGKEERLSSRATDLPWLLASAAPGTELVAESHGIIIRKTKTGFQWKASDERIAGLIAGVLERP